MATNKWTMFAKDIIRVAHSYRMTVWGPTAHTYTWGMQGPEPELGSSTLSEPIFCVDDKTNEFIALKPIVEELDEDDDVVELLSFDPSFL